ncbi:MAG: HAMP domain-containing sensor histidine kinase [Lachnospiraceae bacterium]|nr:HAMP domain-containing sensor histidine kinase [Lachnospiraceae bacterium]
MFKKVRIKIIVSIMSILFAVFAGTLIAVYIVSYRDVMNKNIGMMAEYAQDYNKDSIEDNREDLPPSDNHKNHKEIFDLTSFYSVSLADNGSIQKTENKGSSGLSDDELTALAKEVVAGRKKSGSINHMLYLINKTGEGKLIVFMNNTIADDSFTTLFRYTLIFGCCTLVILFFFSYFISGHIIRPLKESFEKQKQFVSDASHELKTPLSVISANADLLSHEIGENKWLANIQSENIRMANLVKQLLQLTKSETSNIPFYVFDLSRVVTGCTLPFESLAFEGKIELIYDISEGIKILGNDEQIGQVVSILIDNAINHTFAGGKIKVSLKRNRGNIMLNISNTGEEIPIDKRDKIFERFYRLDESRNREANRYGLGLSIAKAIVTEHKGKISVDCADGWTTFTVTLATHIQ